MELLQQHNLLLKPEKCEFEKLSVEYLGVIVSHDLVKMDPVKVAGVMEWLIPTNKKEVQSFLGFTNFYRRFIEGFSHVARPLFDLTKVDSTFHWSMEEQLAFDTLWERICKGTPFSTTFSDSDSGCIPSLKYSVRHPTPPTTP